MRKFKPSRTEYQPTAATLEAYADKLLERLRKNADHCRDLEVMTPAEATMEKVHAEFVCTAAKAKFNDAAWMMDALN